MVADYRATHDKHRDQYLLRHETLGELRSVMTSWHRTVPVNQSRPHLFAGGDAELLVLTSGTGDCQISYSLGTTYCHFRLRTPSFHSISRSGFVRADSLST